MRTATSRTELTPHPSGTAASPANTTSAQKGEKHCFADLDTAAASRRLFRNPFFGRNANVRFAVGAKLGY